MSISAEELLASYKKSLEKNKKKKKKEEDIAPVKGGLDFFQKGAFEDGYQIGDVTKAILGTTADIGAGVVKGAAKLAGGIADAGMYGVAGLADLVGADQFANDVRVKAQENVIDDAFSGLDEYMNQYSLLGQTSNAVTEGLGQVGALILTGGAAGLGAVGTTALTTGAMGLSSFGSGMSEAYAGGATDEEAATYGLISGIVNAGSELIFGGLGKTVKALGFSKGLSNLDDVFARKLSSKIANQTAKNFVEYGVKASAEGVEEVLAGIGEAVGKKLTYMSEEELAKLVEDENLLEQFVVGAVTSGISQSGIVPGMASGSLKEANQTGRDFITGMTENDQKVVDKLVADRIAEESKGKKLSQQDKDKLYDEVMTALERGEVSFDTIAEVMDSEGYKAYKDLVAEEEKTAQGLADLYNGEELDKELAKFMANTESQKVRDALDEKVYGMVKDGKLAESYLERGRRGQSFEADLSKYDEKQRTTVQNAINSGILNNTRRTHEFVDLIARITADKGVSFDFTNNEKLKGTSFAVGDGKTVNGFVTADGVTLNIDSAKSLNKVVGHEITHVLEGTELYGQLKEVLEAYAKSRKATSGDFKDEYSERYHDTRELYKDVEGYTGLKGEEKIKNEVIADLVGDYLFTDADFVNHLVQNKNLFQKLWDEVKYLHGLAKAGSPEEKKLLEVKRAFERAWTGGKAQKNTTDDGGVQFSLKNKNLTINSRVPFTTLTGYINVAKYDSVALGKLDNAVSGIKRGTYENDATGYRASITADTIGKALYPSKNVDRYATGYIRNLNAMLKLPELFKVAVYVDSKPPQKAKNANTQIKEYHHFVAPVLIGTDTYRALITAREKKNSNTLYVLTVEVLPMQKKARPLAAQQKTVVSQLRGVPSDISIPELVNGVKIFNYDTGKTDVYSGNDIQFSLGDTGYMDAVKRGDTDTAQKMVDEAAKAAGYTVKAYHGTARSDRVGNVFLPERATSGPMAFFTDDRSVAEGYSKSKQDTSIAYDPDFDRYETQFRIKAGKRDIPLYEAWGYLPFDARKRITQKAGQLREDWDGDGELMLDPDTNEANGGFQWQLKEARGNAIQALTEQWLNSGNLFNEESRFLDVLEMTGVTGEFKNIKGMGELYFKDPNARHEKVYETYLKINAPFDTANSDEQFISDLEEWYDEQDQNKYVSENMKSDLWDKNGIDAYDFAERLRGDIENNTTHAWTSIPDSVTDYLKQLGYDGIKDAGGKYSGIGHTVWIPFSSEQVKSAEPVTYDDNGNVIPLSERFNSEVPDIRYSLSPAGEQDTTTGYNVTGKDIALSEDIGPVRETVVETVAAPVSAPEETTASIPATRKELHSGIVDSIKAKFAEKGFDLDEVLRKAKNLSTFSTVDNTPQRVMEKALGYKAGQTLADATVNKVAQNETAGIKWLNSYTDRKNGILAQISKKYNIKPGSKESAAAQMYAEGFYVGENNDIIEYGDAELAKDFPDAQVQKNIKGLAADKRIRQIYDQTLEMINASRTRNAYPEIPRLDNYFLHFRAMDDTFSRLGLPFNPNDIRAKDLPTDLNGVTADLKPGQPYFASAKHRLGKRTSFDLLGGLERYLSSAKNQIYHIDDIQNLRALRNYIADTYGQANGLEGLAELSEEEAQERIEQVFGSHLSTFAKFLNEEANILAGKTSLIDRGLEGVIGRRGMTFLDNVNKQVGSNMVGYNISSSLTNFLPVAQALAKSDKGAFVKAFAQTVSGKISRRSDGFAEASPVMIRRKGADRFYRTLWQKVADPGYALIGAVDDISTELIARTKFNELVNNGMDEQKAHLETDKWVSRLMGDRSIGQQPQLYNSKMLGLITKFQLEVRNQLDSQFYDTIQEAKVSNEQIQNEVERNARTAAKVASTFAQLAIVQHLFGAAFEAVAGYNPAFDIIEVLMTTLGFDDDEDSEDTALDNLEQGFMALLEDLPYTSTLTGGRIPISNALPITELVRGTDEYGNEKSRLETLKEVAPYYLLPGGYGQAKKTAQGLGMFNDDLPISGSYTDSGKLRFTVDDTLGNRIQAGIFGQYASKNARDYFDNERAPLTEKQTQELVDVDIPIADYWKYRDGLKDLSTLEEKADYIATLDLPIEKKNLLVNNQTDRKEPIDLTDYDKFGSFADLDYATKNPGEYAVSKAVAPDLTQYKQIASELNNIKSDKDDDGKTISGSRKAKVIEYINSLDLDYGQKITLYKSEYNSDNSYNREIVEYLNSRNDLTYKDIETILKELGFNVGEGGRVWW